MQACKCACGLGLRDRKEFAGKAYFRKAIADTEGFQGFLDFEGFLDF